MAAHVDTIDWANWIPTEKAVLCFVHEKDNVLLIHKKTGLGTGKINAPGGRIENGESAEAAAIRETMEETGVVPSGLIETGQLFFEFTDGYKLHGVVFFASGHKGIPVVTREADPFWCKLGSIPYEHMWEDDRHWLPIALSGKYVKGFFVFDSDLMLSKKIEVSERT